MTKTAATTTTTTTTEINLEYALYKNYICVVPVGKNYNDLTSAESAAVRALIGENSESVCENVWRAKDLSKIPAPGMNPPSERAQKILDYLKEHGTLRYVESNFDDDGYDLDFGFQEEVRQALFPFPLEDCDDRTEEGLLNKVKALVSAWQDEAHKNRKKKKF